jgi:hypothetical protein
MHTHTNPEVNHELGVGLQLPWSRIHWRTKYALQWQE